MQPTATASRVVRSRVAGSRVVRNRVAHNRVAGSAAPGSSVRDEWLRERPAWTQASWWDADMRAEVRALLWLPAGADLVAAVSALGGRERCPLTHAADRVLDLPRPGSTRGWPCACQVIVAAAWEACGSWVAARSATALVDAAGRQPVEVLVDEGRRSIVDPAREELAVATRWSVPTTGSRIAAARALTACPPLLDLVARGAITAWAGRLVTEHLGDLSNEQAAAVVAHVVDRVEQRQQSLRRPWHSAEINRLARAARLRLCPRAEQEARVRAFAGRRVVLHPRADGMATLIAELSETDAVRVHRRLTAIATALQRDLTGTGTPEVPTRDQARADALVDLILGNPGGWSVGARSGTSTGRLANLPISADVATDAGRSTAAVTCAGPVADGGATSVSDGAGPVADGGATPVSDGAGPVADGGATPVADGATPAQATPHTPRGVDAGERQGACGCLDRPPTAGGRPEINVIVNLATLLGLREDPGEVPGLGLIPPDVARALAADGTWRAWITDTTGAVTGTGSAGYVPTAAIARLVRAREPHCRFPGCRQQARRCDLDHAIPWPHGATTPENLGPLCRRHHQLKTHLGWDLYPEPAVAGESPPASRWQWRSPARFTIGDTTEPPLTT